MAEGQIPDGGGSTVRPGGMVDLELEAKRVAIRLLKVAQSVIRADVSSGPNAQIAELDAVALEFGLVATAARWDRQTAAQPPELRHLHLVAPAGARS